MTSDIYKIIDTEVSSELEQFLDGYFKLALQNVFNADELFDYLYRNPKLPVDVKEYFAKSKDRLDKVIAIDYLAHQIHVDPSLCDKIFGGGSEEAKVVLDYLSGEEADNDVRKYNRGMFTTIKSDDGIVWLSKSTKPLIIAGYASIAHIDREGHLIPTEALDEAFQKFMRFPEYRNIMLAHSDLQVGTVIPEWKDSKGKVYKSGVDEKGLYIVCMLRDDLNVMKKVKKEILAGNVRSFSIAGEALEKNLKTKFGRPYYIIPHLEFSEITLCEEPVNQGSGFDILQKGYKTISKDAKRLDWPSRRLRISSSIDLKAFLTKNLKGNLGMQKQGPPGPPPRPGLVWYEPTHRWIRPEEQEFKVGQRFQFKPQVPGFEHEETTYKIVGVKRGDNGEYRYTVLDEKTGKKRTGLVNENFKVPAISSVEEKKSLNDFLSKQSKSNLVPKRIQVHREGKIFERTQMVRPEEAKTKYLSFEKLFNGKSKFDLIRESDFPAEAANYLTFLEFYWMMAQEKPSDRLISLTFNQAKRSTKDALKTYNKYYDRIKGDEIADEYDKEFRPQIADIVNRFNAADSRLDKVMAIEKLAHIAHVQEIWSPLLFGIDDYNDPIVEHGAKILDKLAK